MTPSEADAEWRVEGNHLLIGNVRASLIMDPFAAHTVVMYHAETAAALRDARAERDALRARIEAELRLPGMTGPACTARDAYDDLHRRVRAALSPAEEQRP